MVIRFRSPVLKPLLRADQPLPADRSSVFRVTQRFTDRDFYWNDGRTHSATDIGDFGCGSPLVAMADGTAYRVKDNASQIQPGASDALGVRIDHGELEPGVRITSEIWHMGGWTFNDGQAVRAGQQVGIVGNTGLGAVCHAHVEAKRNGVKFDPEPLMFGGTLGEDDMALNKADVNALFGRQLVTRFDVRVRREHSTTSGIIVTMPAGSKLIGAAVVTGQFLDVDLVPAAGNQWYAVWVEEGTETKIGYVHDSTVREEAAPVTGITQAQLEAAELKGYAAAKGKARVAVESI